MSDLAIGLLCWLGVGLVCALLVGHFMRMPDPEDMPARAPDKPGLFTPPAYGHEEDGQQVTGLPPSAHVEDDGVS